MENARTVFEVRTNMLRLNANYSQKDEICCKCGKQETTKHIFECEDSTDEKISRESYRDMIRKAGPKQDSARQSAEAIRNYMDERTKIKQIINKLDEKQSSPLQRSVQLRIQPRTTTLSLCTTAYCISYFQLII